MDEPDPITIYRTDSARRFRWCWMVYYGHTIDSSTRLGRRRTRWGARRAARKALDEMRYKAAAEEAWTPSRHLPTEETP